MVVISASHFSLVIATLNAPRYFCVLSLFLSRLNWLFSVVIRDSFHFYVRTGASSYHKPRLLHRVLVSSNHRPVEDDAIRTPTSSGQPCPDNLSRIEPLLKRVERECRVIQIMK